MCAILESQQEGDDGNAGDYQGEDGDDLGDPAIQVRLHDVGVREDAFVVSEPVHGAHGHKALRNQRKYLVEGQRSASCSAVRKDQGKLTMATMTQMQSHRNPKTPAHIFPPGETDAVFARKPTKMRANTASVHVTPRTKGPLPPYAGTIGRE